MGRLVVFGTLITLAAQGWAGMRCDQSLVLRGFTPFEVLERCGEPEFEYRYTDFRYPGIWVHIDEWTYDVGPNKFRRQLTFENGRLRRIELRDKPRRSGRALYLGGER